MKIGIFGAPLNNGNMGCMAITYSLLSILEEIEKNTNNCFNYVFFDWEEPSNIKSLISNLKIKENKILFCKMAFISSLFRNIKNCKTICNMKKMIKQCDLIIDMTEGDSFSDIYGNLVFNGRTNIKLYIEKVGVPLILGPQTYGPFINKKNKEKAKKVIKNADLVFTRDNKSKKYIDNLADIKSICTLDVAFGLPFNSNKKISNNIIKIGVNISGLLSKGSKEMNNNNISLKTDYDEFIFNILSLYSENKGYEVHLISHVYSDYKACLKYKKEFSKCILVDFFDNPIDAKNYISNMDVFIGARMHATIAALTTNVACIPTSYSPKFERLFTSINYNYIIDMEHNDTIESTNMVKEYVKDYIILKKQCSKSLEGNIWKAELFKNELAQYLASVKEDKK